MNTLRVLQGIVWRINDLSREMEHRVCLAMKAHYIHSVIFHSGFRCHLNGVGTDPFLSTQTAPVFPYSVGCWRFSILECDHPLITYFRQNQFTPSHHPPPTADRTSMVNLHDTIRRHK
jgi:hypothetical protein